MLPTFDPYHQWLGIPPAEQPPDQYRLLGIARFEADANVISNAADRQMTHVRTFQIGPHAADSQRLLTELAMARRCLLTPAAKASYDYVLRSATPADSIPDPQMPQLAEPAVAAPVAQILQFGPYQVIERTSASTLGVTYKVVHRPTGWFFSLKTLPPATMKNEEVVKRFQREIEIATKLNHPNLITGIDAGVANNLPYLVTQYVVGTDLATLVKQVGPLPVEQATDYIAQAARGLTQLHLSGVYHRNLKPQVLLVDMQGRLRIANLLLARVESSSPMAHDEDLTRMGTMMGSADYLPPEQAVNAKTADARSDIYALGCTLYFLLTGRPPYLGKGLTEKLVAHQRAPVPTLRSVRPDVSEELDLLFQQMLAKTPERRPQFMGAIVERLEPRASSLTWWQRLLAKLGWSSED